MPVGFQNPAAGPDLGFLCSSLVLVDEAAEDGPALDPLLGEVRDRVVGPGRAELSAAMRAAKIVRRCRSPKMSIRSVTSVRAVSTNRSA
jgi:hypothetical protein